MVSRKKAQGLSLGTIATSIIVLVVIVVVIAVVTGKLSFFSGSVDNCATTGGSCETSCDSGKLLGGKGSFNCEDSEFCCAQESYVR